MNEFNFVETFISKIKIKVSLKYFCLLKRLLLYPLFSLEKTGYINFLSKSVRLSVRACVRPSVTFLVNVSPPKPLEVATSNLVGE